MTSVTPPVAALASHVSVGADASGSSPSQEPSLQLLSDRCAEAKGRGDVASAASTFGKVMEYSKRFNFS